MASARGYTTSRFLVELEGKPAGYVRTASGGQPVGQVVDDAPTASGLVKKHLEGLAWEPIVFEVSTGMTEAFYDWLARLPARKQKPVDGALVFVDYNATQQSRLDWSDGVITELVFPEVDAAAREQAAISVTVQPQNVKFDRSSGRKVQVAYAHSTSRLMRSNFTSSIGGMPVFSPRITKVGPITVTQEIAVIEGPVTIGAVHIGDVEVTGRAASADEMWRWLEDFVIAGNNTDEFERSLYLDYLSTNLKTALVDVKLGGVGIATLRDIHDDDAAKSVGKVVARLYAEELAVEFHKSIFATPPPPQPDQTGSKTTPDTPPTKLTTEDYLHLWAAGSRTARPILSAEAVAARLRESATAASEVVVADTREDEGRRFGEMWAREISSREELDAVAGLAGSEWSTVTLGEDHSLLWALNRAGETADPSVTTLTDDPFVRGVLQGAATVRREVDAQLGGSPEDGLG